MTADIQWVTELWPDPGLNEIVISEAGLRLKMERFAGNINAIMSACVLPLPFANFASKKYCEFELVNVSSASISEVGIRSNVYRSLITAQDTVTYRGGGTVNRQGTSQAGTYASWTTGDVIGMAYDPATATVWFAKNNTWQNSSNPATPTGGIVLSSGVSNASAMARPCAAFGITGGTSGVNLDVRFHGKSGNLAYSPPSGFVAWDDGANTFGFKAEGSIVGTGDTTLMAYWGATYPGAREYSENAVAAYKAARASVLGGDDYIDGTVDIAGVAGSRQLILYDFLTRMPLTTVWSDPSTGYYRFDGVNKNRKYVVVGTDYTHTYNGVIQDNLSL